MFIGNSIVYVRRFKALSEIKMTLILNLDKQFIVFSI
jgi:hypothetical protein